MIIRVL